MSPQIHEPKVWIVIPTYNRRGDLLKCLDSVLNLEGYDNFEVVVVDNGSEDNSAADVRNHYPQVHVIDLPDNRGAAVASNIGLSYAYERNADYFLRLDSDTTLAPTSLSRFIEEAKNRPDAGVLGAKILYYDQPEMLWSAGAIQTSWFFGTQELGRGQPDGTSFDEPWLVDFVWSAGILITRRAYEATKGFDPDFFVYYEDTDFCLRVRRAGFNIWYIPSAIIWHKVGNITPSSQRAYQWGRGKMLLFRKHSKGFHRAALILFAYSYAVGRAIWPKPNVGNRGPLWDALRGLTNGLFQPILE